MNRWRLSILLALATLVPVMLGAQQAAPPTVMLAEEGRYLTDGQGRSLYIYLRDGQGRSTCYDRCAENWPPLTVTGEPVAGEDAVGGLLGTIQREDGSRQVTYNGWPLYYHARDTEPGDTIGHRLGDIFYLMSASGVRIEEEVTIEAQAEDEGDEEAEAEGGEQTGSAEAAEADEAEDANPLLVEGEQLFARNCATCHGPAGQGRVGPGLDGNPALGRASFVVGMILFGRPDHGMPAFGDQLTDNEVAAVATYVRNAWSNDFGPVTAEEVRERR